jgi:hypothetical protein
MPWSQIAPQFHVTYGRADPEDPQPEMMEVIGQNGSGKTHAVGKIYQERAWVTGRPSIIAAHKPLDRTYLKIGFPVVHNWDQLIKATRDGHTNLIFLPQTRLMGNARRGYFDRTFTDLLDRLWASAAPGKPADTDIVLDDAGFIEDELPDTFSRVKQFLREGRAPGFSTALLKQRPQGGTRLATSETQWTLGFRPADDKDLERWAELFGARRDWMPVFRSLNRQRREFVIKHTVTQDAYITWIDQPLAPRTPPRRRRTVRDWIGF